MRFQKKYDIFWEKGRDFWGRGVRVYVSKLDKCTESDTSLEEDEVGGQGVVFLARTLLVIPADSAANCGHI